MSRLPIVHVLVLALVLALGSACGGGSKPAATAPAAPPANLETASPSADAPEQVAAENPPADAARSNRWMDSKTPTELTWAPLDPNAPAGAQLAVAWGDPKTGPSGAFLKLAAGSAGSLHVHASDYHGVAIAGTLTNPQDGGKSGVALTPQSYWFQPAGLAHTTTCNKGVECLAFVHFTGPFDLTPVKPTKGAKADPRYVEKRAKDLTWQPLDAQNPKSAQAAQLWTDAQSGANGMLLEIPAGNESYWHIHKFDYHAVVLAGTVNNIESGRETKDLPVGSYWTQPRGNKHTTNCKAGGADCVVYVHFLGAFDIKAVP